MHIMMNTMALIDAYYHGMNTIECTMVHVVDFKIYSLKYDVYSCESTLRC